jgi:hypothetical protein
MTHEQAHTLLLDLAYGELAPGIADEVRRHADGCAACAEELDAIAAARGLAAMKVDAELPARQRDALVAAARRGVAPRPRRGAWRPRLTAFVATAAVVAIVAGVVVKVMDDRTEPPLTAPAPPRSPSPPFTSPRADAPEQPTEAAPRTRRDSAPEREAMPRRQAAEADAPSRAPADAAPGAPLRSKAASDQGLSTVTRRLTCGGAPVERIAVVTSGGRVVKLTIRHEGGGAAEAWYDEDGTRRATRTEGPGPHPVLPARAPDLAAVGTLCDW